MGGGQSSFRLQTNACAFGGADEKKAKYAGRNRTGMSPILYTRYDCDNFIKKRSDKNKANSLAAGFAGVKNAAILPPAGVEATQ